MPHKCPPMKLIRATALDIPFIMETERLPGYEKSVNCMPLEKHQAVFDDKNMVYWLALLEDEPVAFCLIHNYGNDHHCTTLRRAAVTRTDGGIGRHLLGALVHNIFTATKAHRIQLGVLEDNVRGIHTYEHIGFRKEGIMRDGVNFRGVYRDELIMSLLRPEWAQHDFYAAMRERYEAMFEKAQCSEPALLH